MKRTFYIAAFSFLGVLGQFLLHAWLEMWYMGLLVDDFASYSLGLSWQDWFVMHNVFAVVLLIGGTVLGWWQGRYWWPKLYDKNGNRKKGSFWKQISNVSKK